MRRKRKRQLIIISLVLLIGISSFMLLKKGKEAIIVEQSQVEAAEALTMEDKLHDFEYLYSFVENNYPLLKVNERINGVNWLGEKESFIKAIESTDSDEMFIDELGKILEKLNDTDNNVVEMHFYKNYYAGTVNREGDKISPWSDVITQENTMKRYRFDESQLKLVTDSNQHVEKSTKSSYFSQDIIVPNEVAYLKIHSMDPDNLKEDGHLIREFFKEVKDYKKLIIDVRATSYWVGDTDDYWIKNIVEPLTNKEISVNNYILGRGEYGKTFHEYKGMKFSPIEELADGEISAELQADFDYYSIDNRTISPVEAVGFTGEIYVLINNKTVVLAENFAGFCKDSGFATLVGETTSGINWPFETIIFSLPKSGILVNMRNLIGLNKDGSIREEVNIRPDIEVTAAIGSTYERDSAIQYIINN